MVEYYFFVSGILIESPAECAVRELREETGIQLDASEVRHLPCVELPHTDNLNPHCGRFGFL